MTDRLTLSTPSGHDETSKISSALELAENKKHIKEMEKNIADLEKLQHQKENADQQKSTSANKVGARKNGDFKAVSTAPSINKTPVGNSTPPLPYPTIQDLSNSVSTTSSVRFNSDQVYVLDKTKQPAGKGDNAGTANGVKSGTVNGEVTPTKASSTVRAEKKYVVRENDPNTMNGGNNPGIYITTQTPSAAPAKDAAKTSNPPATPETAQEQSAISKWWNNAKSEMGAAVDHPIEGLKGAAKGIANIPSELLEMMAKGGALQNAGDMEQAAAMQSLFGQTQAAQSSMEVAAAMREGASQIDVPKFSMNNPAQAGGDKISTAVQLLAGGAGIVKSGAKGLGALGKAGAGLETQAVKGALEGEQALSGAAKVVDGAADAAKTAEAANTAKAADGAANAGKAEGAAAKPAGDGVKIIERIKSLREKYLGRTPGKSSKTGKEVQERMRAEGKLREDSTHWKNRVSSI